MAQGIRIIRDVDGIAHVRAPSVLAAFEGRPEADALHKLAAIDMPGDEAGWRREFIDAVAQLNRQTLQQRIDELNAKQREEGLDATDKAELRELLQARGAAQG